MYDNRENLNYVYLFPSVHGTTNAVNYAAGNNTVNTFLWHFDVWGGNGRTRLNEASHSDPYKQKPEVWFECAKEFLELCKAEPMKQAFRHMGVEVVFEYPFKDVFPNK